MLVHRLDRPDHCGGAAPSHHDRAPAAGTVHARRRRRARRHRVLDSPEGLELAEMFPKIGRSHVRRQVLDLVRAMADEEFCRRRSR